MINMIYILMILFIIVFFILIMKKRYKKGNVTNFV